jgi:hypothetical protein
MEYHLTAKEMVMVLEREIFQPYILGKRSWKQVKCEI